MNYKNSKRALDLTISAISIVIFFPFLLLVGLLIFIVDRQNPLFTQKRAGKGGKPFMIYKFSTMKTDKDLDVKLSNITNLGFFLRKYSIDELPQIVNVLKGEMSLVGPRPLPISYLSYYSLDQMRRHDVKPGITGMVQISGRNSLDWDTKFDLDVTYANTASFKTDLIIILRTFKVIFTAENINVSDSITAKPFISSHKTVSC